MVANITPLPPAPVRGSTESTFSAAANLFVAALPTLVTEINTAGDDMELAVTAAQLAETNAETAETNAETAQTAAESARDLAYASSNFKGLWSSLVGALAKPASVAHNDLVWLLLNNLADVTASEPSTSNADWLIAAAPPTSVSLDVTANSNGITAGNVVELTSAGGQNVQNIYHCEAPTIGSLVTLDGTNDLSFIKLAALETNTAVAAWYSGEPFACVVSTSSTNTTKVALSTNNENIQGICQLNTSNFSILTAGVASHLYVGTVSGTNITLSTGNTNIAMQFSYGKADMCALTPSNWFVAYADTNSDSQIRTAVSNGTNAPTLGTSLNVNSGNDVNYISLARTTATSAILILQDATSSLGKIANIDGGTTNAPTKSTLANLDGTNSCTHITQSSIDSNHTLCAYNNATTSNGCLAVIQANGTNEPTVVSRSTLPELNPGFTGFEFSSLTAHSANLHTLAGQEKSTGDGFAIPIYVDAQYNATFGAKVSLQGSTNTLYNAIAALTPTTAIAAFQGSGSDGFAGTLTLTPTPIISGQLVGLASTSATNGATASVDVGPLVTGTYTSGLDYYAAGAGGLTTTATPVHVLRAKSTTEGVLELRGNPAAGKVLSGEITVPGAFTWTVPYDGEYVLTFCGGGGAGSGTASQGWPGNGGNSVILRRKLSNGFQISGSIGAGGAGTSSSTANGGIGGSTTITIGSEVFTATGGLGGLYYGSSLTGGSSENRRNTSTGYNEVLGTPGRYSEIDGNAGGSSIFTTATTQSTQQSGTRGGGGTPRSSGTSGSGGSGVFRWELVIGS